MAFVTVFQPYQWANSTFYLQYTIHKYSSRARNKIIESVWWNAPTVSSHFWFIMGRKTICWPSYENKDVNTLSK